MEETTPIEGAKAWLKAAEASAEVGAFSPALYAMEMAVEIALKSVLIAVGVDVPKVHDIRRPVKTFLLGKRSVPKGFSSQIPEYLRTFESLLRLRPGAGYGFEGGLNDPDAKEFVLELMPGCRRIVGACESAVREVGQSSRIRRSAGRALPMKRAHG